MSGAMTNGMAIKLAILGFVALASLAAHQAVRATAAQPSEIRPAR
jgi:hypothetical protein